MAIPHPPPTIAPMVFACLVVLTGFGGCRGERLGEAIEVATTEVVVTERSRVIDSPLLRSHPTADVDFVHLNGRSGSDHLAEITCGGGALFDADGDGDLDLFLPQGRSLGDAATVHQSQPEARGGRLFQNQLDETVAGGDLQFEDVTELAGMAPAQGSRKSRDYGCAAAAGDYDNDGHVDLLVLTLGVNRLWRNLGPNTAGTPRFADVTERAGLDVEAEFASSVAAVWFDYDRDGWLDVFVANNLEFVYEQPPRCFSLTGSPDYCGPGAFAPQPDRLWRNRGDGTFEDVTQLAGLAGSRGPALGAVFADVNGDGWQDLYVANDGQPNYLWLNLGPDRKGEVRFEDRALLAGCAVNADGASEAGMGVAAADYDRDGDIDLFVAHLARETNTLYRNDGEGQFEDVTRSTGLGPPSRPFTGFGAGWLDADNDGWLDLLVVHGAVTKMAELERQGDPFPLHQPNHLYRNEGSTLRGEHPRFSLHATSDGEALARSEVSRGLILGDLDNDGDTDAVIVNNGGRVRVVENVGAAGSLWVGLRLVGDAQQPRDMLGAEVTLIPGAGQNEHEDVLRRWVRSDGSYNASRDPRVLFGLGERFVREGADSVVVAVRWPDGHQERFASVPTGRYSTLRRGTGEVARL